MRLHSPHRTATRQYLDAQQHAIEQRRRQATTPRPPYVPANDSLYAWHTNSKKIRAIFGGNRSGKTETAVVDLVQTALSLPAGSTCWVCAKTNELFGTTLYPKLKKYLRPSDIAQEVWANSGKAIPAQVNLTNGVKLIFKSYEQGWEVFQSASVNYILLDERPNSQKIYEECLLRTVDCSGRIVLAMSPLYGRDWVWDQIGSQAADHPYIHHQTISLLDNRYVSDADKAAVLALLSEDEIKRRVHGEFTELVGDVWKDFDPARNLCSPFPIPEDWTVRRSIDLGYRAPFVCQWAAHAPTGELFLVAEHYQAGWTIHEHADAIKAIDAQLGVTGRYIESISDHEAQTRAELEAEGIWTIPAQKDIVVGIEETNRRFKAGTLTIFSTLKHTRRELGLYHYPEERDTTNPKEVPVDKDNHTQDTMRYHVMRAAYGGGYTRPVYAVQ